jgi:uncharacterized protein YkwD
MVAAAHRRTRHRARVLGPVLSVLAVLLVTAPATWLTLRTDQSGLADRIPDSARAARDDAARAASRGGPRPATTNRDGAPGTTKNSTPPRTAAGKPSSKPTKSASTARPSTPATMSPSPRTTRKPKPTQPPTSTAPPPATTSTPPSGGSPSSYETEVVRLTNVERAKAGCGALTVDSSLTRSAGGHAADMVARHFFNHTNPDGKDPFERMADAGFHGSAMAENIAMGYATPQAAITGWMNSSGHRANILNCGYNRIGVGYDAGQILDGYSKGSWVQNFGTK